MLAFLALAFSQDVLADTHSAGTSVEAEGADSAQGVISQLTIAMSAEVVDERTFAIRDASAGSKQVHLCLGNVGPTPRGSLDDGEYEEKKKVAKEALGKLVDKQMIWYKAAPEPMQRANSSDAVPVILADVWTTEGRHISSLLKTEGHLAEVKTYEEELAKDILSVAAEQQKKEDYKKLEEALKESEKAKQEAARASRAQAEAEEANEVESIGLGGWVALLMVVALAVGVATNFGRPSQKKNSLNRKKGACERFMSKIKGA